MHHLRHICKKSLFDKSKSGTYFRSEFSNFFYTKDIESYVLNTLILVTYLSKKHDLRDIRKKLIFDKSKRLTCGWNFEKLF